MEKRSKKKSNKAKMVVSCEKSHLSLVRRPSTFKRISTVEDKSTSCAPSISLHFVPFIAQPMQWNVSLLKISNLNIGGRRRLSCRRFFLTKNEIHKSLSHTFLIPRKRQKVLISWTVLFPKNLQGICRLLEICNNCFAHFTNWA